MSNIIPPLVIQQIADKYPAATGVEYDKISAAKFGYSLSSKRIEEVTNDNNKLASSLTEAWTAVGKRDERIEELEEALRKINQMIRKFSLEEQFGLDEDNFILTALESNKNSDK